MRLERRVDKIEASRLALGYGARWIPVFSLLQMFSRKATGNSSEQSKTTYLRCRLPIPERKFRRVAYVLQGKV